MKKILLILILSTLILSYSSGHLLAALIKNWDFKAASSINDIHVSDLDQNGSQEIIIGTDTGLAVINKDGKSLWSIITPGKIVRVSSCDFNGDGLKEAVAGSEYEDFGTIYVYDKNGRFLWSFKTGAQGPLGYWPDDKLNVDVIVPNDIDGDGKEEIVTGSNHQWFPYRICVIGEGGKLKGEYWNPGWSGISNSPSIQISDVDNDGDREMVVGLGNNDYNRRVGIALFDGDDIDGEAPSGANGGNFNAGSQKWYWLSDVDDSDYCSISLFDLNRDGYQEIIEAYDYEAITTEGVPYGAIYALNYKGDLLWSYPGKQFCSVLSTDLDGDGYGEVIGGGTDGRVYCLNHEGTLIWSYSTSGTTFFTYISYAGDIDLDGFCELVIVSDKIYVLSHRGVLKYELAIENIQRGNVKVLSADSKKNLLLAPNKNILTSFLIGSPTNIYYRDADGDNYGDTENWIESYTIPLGFVKDSTDCDDTDPTVHPDAPEIYDNKDNDCDGVIPIDEQTIAGDRAGTSFGNDRINIDLVGKWGYGGKINCIEVLDPDTLESKNRYAYCGTSYGLLVMDISKPDSPEEVLFMKIGDVKGIAFSHSNDGKSRYALLASGRNGLLILDISNPIIPAYAGRYDTECTWSIAVEGNLAYLADSKNGLVIIDISDPGSPSYVGGYDTEGDAWDIVISGKYACVVDNGNGLVIIDVSNPASPVYAGRFEVENIWSVAVKANFAYVTDYYNGLMIIDISNPQSPSLVGKYRTGNAWDVAISGNFAYVAHYYDGLVIIDISNPDSPSYAGGYHTGNAQSVAVNGNFAYVTNDSGLVIIDVTDPTSLAYTGKYDYDIQKGCVVSVVIDGSYAYLSDRSTGLIIIDISNPSSPSYKGSYSIDREAWDFTIDGNYAFVGDAWQGLSIIDISNPNSPSYAGGSSEGGFGRDVVIRDKLAYFAADWGGLVIFDISNPHEPSYLGRYDTEGNAYSVTLDKNYAYVADSDKGLAIIDISNPASPSYMGGYDTEGCAWEVAIKDNHAYIADGDKGLVIIEVSNPASPSYRGGYDTRGYAYGIAIKDNYAYVADGPDGIVLIDISNPALPSRVGGYDTEGSSMDVKIEGKYLYIADASGLVIVEMISDPTGPGYEGEYNIGNARNIAVGEDYAYVANNENGLMVINISNPTLPSYVGKYDLRSIQDVAVDKKYAYLADTDKGLVIVDISDPVSPLYAGEYNTGNAQGIAVKGNYAYIADNRNGLVIIDISNPYSPLYAGEYDTGNAQDVAVKGDYAYVTDIWSGLVIIDISNPHSPSYAGGYDTKGYACGIAVDMDKNYAYIADNDKGFVIVDILNPHSPTYVGGYDTGNAQRVAVKGDYAYVADNWNGLVTIDISNPASPSYVGGYGTGNAQSVIVKGNYVYVADKYNGLMIFHIIDTLQHQGNLTLCSGGPFSSTNPLFVPFQNLTNLAYGIFQEENYPLYFTYYLTPNPYPDITGDGTLDHLAVDDFDPTVSDMKYALTDWAYNRLNTGPLYLYFTGLGKQDAFQIFPGEILKSSNPDDPNDIDTLKSYLDIFQDGTHWDRDVFSLLEFSSSGSFCDDLIDANTSVYSRTIITCTDEAGSWVDPEGGRSFTGQLLALFRNSRQNDQLSSLFADTGISHYQRVKRMQGLFSQARDSFWSLGHPFNTQPPQMVTAQGPHTLCSISLSSDHLQSDTPAPAQSDTPAPAQITTITDPAQIIPLTTTGHYLDGDSDLSGRVYYRSSDPSILVVTPDGKVSPNLANKQNGKATILATIIDPNFTQSPDYDIDYNIDQYLTQSPDPDHDHNPSLPPLGGVTGRIQITVDIPTWKEKEGLPLAIIVAGEISKNDNLWEDTHTIAQYAYLTLMSRGYSRSRIQYLTHLEEKLGLNNASGTDLDQDGDSNNDIDGIPSLNTLSQALTTWVKEKGTNSLTLILIDHGKESGGFYLNKDEILTPQLLATWLDELQDQNPNLKISVIIESCYSGLFTNPNDISLSLQSKNRIIITSTNKTESYTYAHGLVSFTYYLLTYLQAGSNLASAYDNARASMSEIDRFLHRNRETLNENTNQLPQLDNRALARTISLGGDFLISQDQPVIISTELSPDPNTISLNQDVSIRVRASDLDGIEKVWVMVNATYSPPVFSGDPDRPIIDLPRIDLLATEEGVYEGTCSGFTYSGPYSLLVFAQDSRGTVSLPSSVSLNVSGQEQTAALLVAGWDPADPGRFDRLVSHAQWVLQEKHIAQVVELLPTTVGIKFTREDVYSNLKRLAKGANQLFVYLVGPTMRHDSQVLFPLNEQESLDPDTLNTWLNELSGSSQSGSSQVILIDTPEAQCFFQPSPDRIYVGSASQKQSACLDQGGYCAFSRFFFTCLYRGASVMEAFRSSQLALKNYSFQTPVLEDGQEGNRAQATYLGSPFVINIAGPRLIVPQDQIAQGNKTLWAEITESDPDTRVWALIKSPGKGVGELEKVDFSPVEEQEGRYQATCSFIQAGTYEITIYTEDSHGLLDYDATSITVQNTIQDTDVMIDNVVAGKTVQDNVVTGGMVQDNDVVTDNVVAGKDVDVYEKDTYEVDDIPIQANPMLINDITLPQSHNFHNAHDVDWVFFHAYPGRKYEIWVERKGGWQGCPLKAALYTLDEEQPDGEQIVEVLDDYDNSPKILDFSGYSGDKQMDLIYPYLLPNAGFYLLKFYYGCDTIPEGASTDYEIIKIINGQAAPTGTICGHVLHSKYRSGIAGVTVKAKIKAANGGTKSIETKSGKGGVFYLFDLEAGNYQVQATAPGYQDSLTTSIPVTENSEIAFTIYLSPNPHDPDELPKSGILGDLLAKYKASIQTSYEDRQKEHIITLDTGMNLFSCPCLPLYADSKSFLREIYHSAINYYQEKDLPFRFSMDIRRYDSQNGRWQTCFIDANQKVHGEIFDLDPQEGYLMYLDILDTQDNDDIHDTNRSLKSLNLLITCAEADSNNIKGYYLQPGINLIGLGNSPYEYDSDRLLKNLMQLKDPMQKNPSANTANTENMANTPATIFHYVPQTGSFYPHYQMFGRPAGRPCQIEEDKGYSLFIKEEIRDWQPE